MTKRPPAALLMLALLGCAGCGHNSVAHQNFPSPADLIAKPEPLVPDAAFTDEKAANDYDNTVLMWGRGLYDQVGRLCHWAAGNGMKGVTCP